MRSVRGAPLPIRRWSRCSPSRSWSCAPRRSATAYSRRMPDAYALVLHSHLPYVRGAGRWPHGEEWVHEAILGTYLPLLVLLHDLRAEGVRYRITIGLTPTLIEQLADPDICTRFLAYADDQIRRAELDAWDFG